MTAPRPGLIQRSVDIPLRYKIAASRDGSDRRLAILLHGFNQRGEKILDPLRGILPDDMAALAPDAPFPIPRQGPDGKWKVGFSWYFWQNDSRSFFIDMEPALALLDAAITDEGFADKPKTVIGFSQGGWLAPVLGLRVPLVTQVIGVGCEYPLHRAPPPHPFRLDAVHGDQDAVVPFVQGQSTHSAMIEAGARGRFSAVTGAGHRFEPAIIAAVRESLLLDR